MARRIIRILVVLALSWAAFSVPAPAADQDNALLRAAQSLLRRKKLDEAEAKIATILKTNPGHPGALRARATLLKARGQRQAAIIALERAYQNVARLPELSKNDEKLLRKIRADLVTADKAGQKLRSVGGRHLLKLTNFAMAMLKKNVDDLHAQVKRLALEIDPGHRVVRQFLKNEVQWHKDKERRRREAANRPMNWGMSLGGGGGGSGPAGGMGPAAGPTGGPGRSTYASDTPFDMSFDNQAMMRVLTQMFWLPGNNAPLVEFGYLYFETETYMAHHRAKLSEGRQLRITAAPKAGVVALGVMGKPDALRVESGNATGPNGEIRVVPPATDGKDVIILQRVDGRYLGFVNGRLIFTVVAELGNDRVAVTLSNESRVYTLALEAAETIVPSVSEEDLDAAQTKALSRQAAEDRRRAASLLSEGRQQYADKQYSSAIVPLSEAAALDPLALEALYLLAKCRQKIKRRRSACQTFRAYLQTAVRVQKGELKLSENAPPITAEKSRLADARKSLKKLDREGRKLERTLGIYRADLKKLRAKVKGDAFTLERLEKRLKQLRKFVVVP